ncbi:MAG: cobalt-precorrin 5A hydrolase [Desulfobacterales bacterium]|nr:cobalt-precorrin 5A hydrolase [Desulfobacterales bacterium]
MTSPSRKIAIWALTRGGAELGRRLNGHFAHSRLYVTASVHHPDMAAQSFEGLRDALVANFHRYQAHVFIMATGIVVRSLVDLLRHKAEDPAVVVMDETGRHVISLLSGHLGGANELARRIAKMVGGEAVITTATDLRSVPAIDMIARERGLTIENHNAIRLISGALLRNDAIAVADPHGCLRGALPEAQIQSIDGPADRGDNAAGRRLPTVVVTDIQIDLPPEVLILRPASLFVGLGCNRGTPAHEIRELLEVVLTQNDLAPNSLAGFASVDLKSDEPGMIEMADAFGLPLDFFSRQQLAQVTDIRTPSATVEKHIGIPSVCEAAAILAAGSGRLIVPKQTTRNVTVAVARRPCSSSD